MQKIIKKIICSRCGRTIELPALPNEKDLVFAEAEGWCEHINNLKGSDLCPDCYAVYQSVWKEFLWCDKMPKGLSVVTPAGKITAKQGPDSDYPGIIMELESKNGRPGVTMEYDPEEKDVIIRVWGKEDPDGDPICVARIGGKDD